MVELLYFCMRETKVPILRGCMSLWRYYSGFALFLPIAYLYSEDLHILLWYFDALDIPWLETLMLLKGILSAGQWIRRKNALLLSCYLEYLQVSFCLSTSKIDDLYFLNLDSRWCCSIESTRGFPLSWLSLVKVNTWSASRLLYMILWPDYSLTSLERFHFFPSFYWRSIEWTSLSIYWAIFCSYIYDHSILIVWCIMLCYNVSSSCH